jgi:hypothetical protein
MGVVSEGVKWSLRVEEQKEGRGEERVESRIEIYSKCLKKSEGNKFVEPAYKGAYLGPESLQLCAIPVSVNSIRRLIKLEWFHIQF